VQISLKFPFIHRDIVAPVTPIAEEKRMATVTGLDDFFPSLRSTDSGIVVNEETALTFSAVWSSVKLLSESVAGLPFQVFKSDNGSKEVVKMHPVYDTIHSTPNPIQTKFTFLQTLMTSVLLYGNGYALIKKDKFARPKELKFLHPDMVTVLLKDDKLFYEVDSDKGTKIYASRDIIHVLGLSTDGYVGKGVIKVAQDSIGLGLASEKFGNLFFSNGSNSELAYETPANLTDEQFTRLTNVLKNRNGGLDKAHKPLLLEGGLSAKQLTIPPEQAQFLQTRKFQVNEIARWFNIPPHMVGDLEKSSNNNIEQQSTEFVQFSVVPWLNRIEQEFTRKLLWEEEKPDHFTAFNVEGLLRGDVKARAEFYRVMHSIGAISDNEIRSKENLNPYEGGDEHYRQINTISIENPKVYDSSEGKDPDGTGTTD